jgi:hypothetical protein
VRARNQFRHAENRIHDDEEARRHGYAAGLVAGTTVYGYLTRPLAAAWGEAWLARGTARLQLRRPVYEGDVVDITARLVGSSGGPAAGEHAVEVAASTSRDPRAAVVLGGLAWGGPTVSVDPAAFPVAVPPASRPPASPESLGRPGPLGAPSLALEPGALARYADELDDPLPLYRGPRAAAHPGLLLQQANRALSENVALGPWVHVASDVAHLGVARAGERLVARGRVVGLFEKKGHRWVELEVLIVADETRPVLHVRHVAIYQLRVPEPSGEAVHG